MRNILKSMANILAFQHWKKTLILGGKYFTLGDALKPLSNGFIELYNYT